MTASTGALSRARQFFDANPDELLTHRDMMVKLDIDKRRAHKVGLVLVQEGRAVKVRSGKECIYAGPEA